MGELLGADAVEVGLALLVVGLPALLIWVWALVDAARNPDLSGAGRAAWLAVVALLPGVGALVYVALPGRRRLRLGG
jgi:hypothetical protein